MTKTTILMILSHIQVFTLPFIIILPLKSLSYIIVLTLAGLAPLIKMFLYNNGEAMFIEHVAAAAGVGMLILASHRICVYVGL